MTYATVCSGINAPGVADGRRNDAKAAAMYALYESGKSLADVGGVFGCTRQCVYDIFKVRGLKPRARQFLPFVEFDGHKYTINKHGYYRCTVGRKLTRFLHQEVWKKFNGPIPEGYDIHHKDEDKTNNDPGNLECLPKPEHTRLYSPHNNQYTRGQKRREFRSQSCLWCSSPLIPHRDIPHKESPSAFANRRFCGIPCSAAWKRGKAKGVRAA